MARAVVTAATTAGEMISVTMKMGRVLMAVIRGIQEISAGMVSFSYLCYIYLIIHVQCIVAMLLILQLKAFKVDG